MVGFCYPFGFRRIVIVGSGGVWLLFSVPLDYCLFLSPGEVFRSLFVPHIFIGFYSPFPFFFCYFSAEALGFSRRMRVYTLFAHEAYPSLSGRC